MSEQLAVYQAVQALMDKVTNVPKTGTYAQGKTRYNFRGVEQLTQDVGEAARAVGLMLTSEVLGQTYDVRAVKNYEGKEVYWTHCRVHMRYLFTSLEDGSTLAFEAIGEGLDNSDKASSKAMSTALKYFLGQSLLIGTDDADPDSERPMRTVEPQRQQAAAPSEGSAPSQDHTVPAPEPSPIIDEEEKAAKAAAAYRAASTATSLAQFERVAAFATQLGILDEMVDGHKLGFRFETIRAQLGG